MEETDNYKIIQLLLQGCLDKIIKAKVHIKANNVAEKGNSISSAITIISGLQASLDLSQGEIAENLNNLYDYCKAKLLKANLDSDPEALNEVGQIISTIKSGWDGIEGKY